MYLLYNMECHGICKNVDEYIKSIVIYSDVCEY